MSQQNQQQKREPAHSTEAEASCIGGILVHPKKFYEVAAILGPSDYYHPALRAIFEAMLELSHANKPIDALTVYEQMRALETADKLRAFGGSDYLTQLMAEIVTVENIGYHARIVKHKAVVRRIGEAARQVEEGAYDPNTASDDFIAEAEKTLFDAFQNRVVVDFEVLEAVLKRTLKKLEERSDKKQTVTGIPTGHLNFDQATAGLQPGHLIIVAARPSMGKSTIVRNWSMNAGQHGFPVLTFTLEMFREEWMEMVLCSEAEVSSTLLRTGALTKDQWIPLVAAAARIHAYPITIDDNRSITLMEIRAKALRWRADPKNFSSPDQMGLIVVDYVQLIDGAQDGGGKEENRQREISKISRGLKLLAGDTNCAVVALSQLNRKLEERSDKRPMKSDLRDSGSLEQDADEIVFIYRDEVYSKDQCKEEDKGIAEIIIDKQRSGMTGTCKLIFQGAYTKFINLPERQKNMPQTSFRGIDFAAAAAGDRDPGEDDE